MHLTYIALETPNPCSFKSLCETAMHIAKSSDIDVRITFNEFAFRVSKDITYDELCRAYCEKAITEDVK